MNITKTQRRRRALRRASYDIGVGGLFFYYPRYDHVISCSVRLDTTRYDLIKSPGMLKSMLLHSVCDGWINHTEFKILHEDIGVEFENVDELKKYLLIERIAGL